MPDPTPTPDTLRAAAERAVREFDRPGYTSMPLPLMSALDALRAALAASPAPTDNPDEPCADCGHPREDHSQGDPPDYSCWHVYVWALGGCDCGSFRPAAVTAPHEDEGGRCGNCGHTRTYHTEKALTWCCWPDDSLNDGLGCMCHEFRLAAAPAVEGATPDPDTLAALIHDTLWNARNAVTKDSAQLLARALIAAGVTLNETAT